MNVRHVGILAGLLAMSAFAVPLTSLADTTEVKIIYLDKAPPAPKMSPPPSAPRVGYVWSPGYWNWNGSAYVWTDGSWVAQAEPTKTWIAPVWTQEGNKWYFTAGHWSS